MESAKKKTIAIIGSGASGVACLLQLVLKYIANRYTDPLAITLFERKSEFGTGLAYGTGQEGHLLNTKAGLMGLFPEERLHFVQWMHEHQALIEKEFPQVSTHPDAYPPRMLYGWYVQDMLKEYCRLAKQHGIDVKEVQAEIVDFEIGQGNTVYLKDDQRAIYEASQIILATGVPASATFAELKNLPKFLQSPWPAKKILHTVHKQARVSIVGSSLTAIDALITLIANGHTGPISFFSLKGLLPRVQSPTEECFERHVLTLSQIRTLIRKERRQLRVKDLIRLFRREVEHHLQREVDWKAEERVNKDHLALLEEDIRQATAGSSLFQNILYALREDSYAIWKLLSVDQKQLFGKWIKPYYDINRHAIPLENGIKLMNILRSKQLTVIGHSDDIQWDNGQFILKTEKGKTYEADYVINASGPATKIARMQDQPLLRNLLVREYVQEYPAGGILVDLHTMQIIGADPSKKLTVYAVGQPVSGMQHDVNSLWFNVEQADLLTDHLLQQL